MKVLILSSNIGGGHNSCANAVMDYFESKGENCTICDSIKFISDHFSKTLEKWHTRIYRYMPKAFSKGYDYVENNPDLLQKKQMLRKILLSGNDRLYKYIIDNCFDTVICTHPFPAIMMTEIQKAHNLPVKTAFIHTDYTCYPITADSIVDLYFTPDNSLQDNFLKCNIPQNKIISSGIPVRKEFYTKTSSGLAKELFGINPDNKHLLIMTGSMGCGPVEKIVHAISKNDSIDISVICGTNKALERTLKSNYMNNKNVHIFGYCNQVAVLMDSADLCLIKPGGISVTEAYVKKLPMVLMNTISGCEEYNTRFFVSKGCAVSSSDSEELIKMSLNLLSNTDRIEKMKKEFGEDEIPNASQIIYDTLKNC